MKKNRNNFKKKITLLLPVCFALLFFLLVRDVFATTDSNKQEEAPQIEASSFIPVVEHAIKYSEYLEKYSSVASGKEEIVIKGSDYISVEDMEEVSVDEDTVINGNSGTMSWSIDLPEEGMYQIKVEYYPGADGGSTIERSIYINGELPFEEVSPVLFYRTYVNENQDYKTKEGNQAFPSQVEKPVWSEVTIKDSNGFIMDPFMFYLKDGENTVSFKSIKDSMIIKSITLTPVSTLDHYEEYLNDYEDDGIQIIENANIKVQGEDAGLKSSPSFFPINDRTSPLSEPYDPTYIVLNTIGGTAWDTVGDWIKWDAEVPESGLYKIVLRYKQSELRGLFATRTIKINDEIPFEEAKDLRFDYKSSFQVDPLMSPEGEIFYFYMKAGHNTITLENSLGTYADLIYEVEHASSVLNDIYQDIVVITGTSPDVYQDYQLISRLPEMIPTYKELVTLLDEINNELVVLAGGTNDKTAVIEKMVFQLERLINKPNDIPKNITSLRDSITALGQWVLDITTQPLTIDYIIVSGKENELPKAEGNVFQLIGHEFKSFIGSFVNDYNVYDYDNAQKSQNKGIEVWVTTGRDQMDVIRQLINESFVSETGIPVTLKLVNSSVLLTATSVARGPDAVVQVSSTIPIDFAVRDAAYDISQFDDFDSVAKNFHPATMNSFEFDGSYYALPDQMSFPVLFYRKDILNENQIPVPQSWDEVVSIIPYLQANNMEFYLDRESLLTLGSAAGVGSTKAINSVFLSMLYQNGGELYNEGGYVSQLDSDAAIRSFTTWTEFYTKHGFSETMDFVTRFRLGQVPLAIMDFTYYNKLSVSAPEIKGDWSVALVPGTKQEDGTLRRDVPVTSSAAVMIKNSVEKNGTKDESWEFLKWWTSAEVQTEYAREMEAVLGSSGRYPVANLESFGQMAWQSDVLKVLTESLDWLREVRQVPGSYITGRYMENAFYEIINDERADEVDVLFDYNALITEELQNKWVEFGLEMER